ncbi:MAG: DUF424 family protein [Candidatus Bathyarchaeia archaeon]
MTGEVGDRREDRCVYVKIFRSSNQILVAACDREVLGMTFRSGRLRLDVKESFYKGSLESLTYALEILSTADVANLTGERIVNAAIEKGCADSKAIIRIEGTPHLQIVRL